MLAPLLQQVLWPGSASGMVGSTFPAERGVWCFDNKNWEKTTELTFYFPGEVSADEFEAFAFLFNFRKAAAKNLFKEFDVSGDQV